MADVCVITGGSRGIGAACVRRATEAGYQVCFSYASNKQAADDLIAEIKPAGGIAEAVQADVGQEADILKLFEAADKMGTVSALVNNAGIVDQSARVDKYTVERLQGMFTVNVIGSFLCAREAIKRMSTKYDGNGGVIVNIGSAAAYIGSPNQYVDYAASKAAIDTFTKGLALEVADEGIRVNAVRPGLIYTDIHASGGQPGRVEKLEHMVPMKRGGSADEVAKAVLWLMSDDASYVTGDSLNVTGGR
jgi:NAD(P)-dependent dehydrogenase (short-subunit alcohol dehydrogenase family)